MRKSSWWLGIGFALGWLVVGCESQPPAGGAKPQSRPAESKTVAPLPEPAEPSAAKPAEAPPAAPEKPELPDYLTLAARFDSQQPAHATVLGAADHRLAIDTRNVQRLRIDRERLPFKHDRSIALILDGQGIEWLANSRVVEFERSANGAWTPVKPD